MAILPSRSLTSGEHQLCNHGRLILDLLSWASLRATEGWAALQHHAVLRTTLTVHPPCPDSQPPPVVPNFLVELKGGSFFALVPADVEWKQRHDSVPEWYSGNIYQVDCAPPHLVNLPTVPSAVSPTVYYLYVSGDYEVLSPRFSPLGNTLLNCDVQIRLFGDPKNGGSETPTLIISVNTRFESSSNVLKHETSYDIAPDFVEGFAFGDALGVGLRCVSTSWWTVTAVSISNALRDAVSLQFARMTGGRLIYSASRELCFPCSRLHDLLLARHTFFLSESRNPNHSTGIRSRSISRSFPLVPQGLFLSDYPLPSLVLGREQVLLLSGRPIFLQTRRPLDLSRSLRRIRLQLSRRQPRRYWPCVCTFTNAVLPHLTPLLQGQMVREWIF